MNQLPVKTISFSPKVPRKTVSKGKGMQFILIALLGLFGLVGTASSDYLKLWDMYDNPNETIGQSEFKIYHDARGCLETQDWTDILWEDAVPSIYPFWLRLGSKPWGKLLRGDARPFKSITPVELFFDVMSRDAPSGEVVCDNYLRVREISNKDGAFNGKPISFQQKSLTGDPSETYPVIDLRRAYALNGGRVTLYDPNGAPHKLNKVYFDGETDLEGVVRFDKYLSDLNDDKVTDIKDLGLLVEHWMEEGFAVVGDIAGEFGIPDGRVDLFDLAVMAEEWGMRFVVP